MAAQVDEAVLHSFRANENDLRDIDSIVRKHCQFVKYYVYRGSTLGGYDTIDIEDIVKERNGAETRIESIRFHATGVDALKFNIDFDQCVEINGECDDRARLAILATEVRSVIRDRLRTRRFNRRAMLQAIGAIALVVGYLIFQGVQNSAVNRFNSAQARIQNPSTVNFDLQQQAEQRSEEELLDQTRNAIRSHNLNTEISLLLQNQVLDLQTDIRSDAPPKADPSEIPMNPPGWETSFWLLVAASLGAAGLAIGFGYLTIADDKSAFLLGDEKARQDNAERHRRNILWGIGVALVVGIAGSYLSSLR